MPVRLNLVTVALNRSLVTLTWTARQALLGRLQHVRENVGLRATFGAVDAAGSVELRPGQRAVLLLTLVTWALDPDGYEPIPQELLDLRDALIAEQHGGE